MCFVPKSSYSTVLFRSASFLFFLLFYYICLLLMLGAMDGPRPSLNQRSISTTEETLISGTKNSPRYAPDSFILSAKNRLRSHDSVGFDEYFVGATISPVAVVVTHIDFSGQLGPRELDRHSKWPMLLRIHGSCVPELILPLLLVGAWTTTVCLFSRHVKDRESIRGSYNHRCFQLTNARVCFPQSASHPPSSPSSASLSPCPSPSVAQLHTNDTWKAEKRGQC